MNETRLWLADLLASFSGQENTLTIPRPYITITGSIEAALLLSQIVYWSDRTKMDDGWFAKSYKDWEDEITLTKRQVSRVIPLLLRVGVETKIRRFNGSPTLHYRINKEKFAQSIMTFKDIGKLQNVTIEDDKSVPSLTEPTTEPTTENPIHASSDADTSKPHPKRHYFEAVAKGVFEISDLKGIPSASLKRIGLLEKSAKTIITNRLPLIDDEQGALLISKYCAAEKFKPSLQGQSKFELGLLAFLEKNATAIPGFLASQTPSPKPEEPTEYVDPEMVKAAMAAITAKWNANDGVKAS